MQNSAKPRFLDSSYLNLQKNRDGAAVTEGAGQFLAPYVLSDGVRRLQEWHALLI